MSSYWQAPQAAGAVRAVVDVPGSKSITNRALVLAALADGPSTLSGPLHSRDTDLMAAGLRALGAGVEECGEGEWRITPGVLHGPADIECGLAGTVMRFLPPVAALADGRARFDGDPRARERPMDTVLDALAALGADVHGRRLPFELRGAGGLPGGPVTLDASASSQFISGLLLAGARYEKGVAVRHDGAPVPSLPHIEMTVHMLRAAGVDVDDGEADVWRVQPGPVAARAWRVEPDLSNAAAFLAAAAVTGGAVTVPRWPESTTQPGKLISDVLAEMGCTVARSAEGLTVTGPNRLVGLDVDLHDVGELAPTVAALAVLADGPSRLRGIAHLRGHETDRLAALAAEITGLGGDAEESSDGLTIRPRELHGGCWHAHADHRMATAGAIIGLCTPGVEVDEIGCTAKTLPDFPGMWHRMLREAASAGGTS